MPFINFRLRKTYHPQYEFHLMCMFATFRHHFGQTKQTEHQHKKWYSTMHKWTQHYYKVLWLWQWWLVVVKPLKCVKIEENKKKSHFLCDEIQMHFSPFSFFVVFLVKCQFFICFISIDCNTIFFQMIGALATLVNVLSEIEFWHLITIQNKRKKCCIVLWECLSICPFYVQWHSQILHNENDDKWMKCAAGPKMGKYSMNRSGEPAFK